jgi:Ca-activated chloride channel homolog
MKFLLTILCSLSLAAAFAQNGEIILGNRLYKEEKYEKAEELYRKSLSKKNSTEAQFNLGNSLYKQDKTDDAIKSFDEAAANASTPEMKAKALYNKAVLYHKANKLNEAVEAYKAALRLTPDDPEIRKNLQLALRALKQKQPDQKKQKPKEQPKKKKEKEPPPQPKPQQSKLNKREAEQYLKALEEKEKQLQEKMRKKTNTPAQPEKDW